MGAAVKVSAEELKENLFQVLDHCRDTGETIRIERGGEVYKLVQERKRVLIADLPDHPAAIAGDPEALHQVRAWEWNPDDFS